MQSIAKWQEQHPKAMFREIEEEIDKSLSELQAKMISDTAMQNAQANWESGAVGVMGPKCGEKSEKKGRQRRTLQTWQSISPTLQSSENLNHALSKIID